ncbi:formylglycine-generating enzyme required for sulfatase activity [Rhizomicrobium palustre]|uniref:Formylglycine-generating enzyme required for sulfatase activity n=1 Tax=Rhizomicrobium palustre TaxID=189966 RepID=A0A846N1T1_9PROT|nr:formylglycine-generating enzyme family protein [Rhizomicrobium palustre]NIK89435.1 formylglycine-generating enzyme required for sulfatase activity [Rhizomicrobium palustre]
MLRRLLLVGCLISGAVAAEPADRDFKECPECPDMIGIPAGKFVMGSPQSEAGRFDAEGPQRIVAVKAFALAKFNVTSEEYLNFLRATGYQPDPCNTLLDMRWHVPSKGLAYPPYDEEPSRWPASCISYKDAHAYIEWLNEQVRKARPNLPNKTGPYRLPSEAEWEYAARAGTTTARWWGDEIGRGHANCNGCGSTYDFHVLANVDSFKPNPFGLYGMLGNVWEWTEDCWHKSYVGAPSDARPWRDAKCSQHVLRGGSWDNVPLFVRSAARIASASDGSEYDYSTLAGFRIARDLP